MSTVLDAPGRVDTRPGLAIDRVEASVYTIPTDRPESDGTMRWDATTLVLARVHAGDGWGLGYTYTDAAAASLIRGILAEKDPEGAAEVPILYGGSCTPENANELFVMPDVDGALVGGASLDSDRFSAIVRAAAEERA